MPAAMARYGSERPERLVVVVGTGTEVGKTWVAVRLVERLRSEGVAVAARKPVQSFDPGDPPDACDAALLARATGEPAEAVCAPARRYEVAMAPPMAAEVLGRPAFTLADVVSELSWPSPWPCGRCTVGLVESAGGVRSPLAADGDSVDLVRLLRPDVVVLVADAGLGTIGAVRMSVAALSDGGVREPVVVVNRFRTGDGLHERNVEWLRRRDGFDVVAVPGDEAALVRRVVG